jgi:nitroimidazol reductase NimA-like FMN-containing flavoprotein (pyridoxamine 5'-phosphate oxidase superfamily)
LPLFRRNGRGKAGPMTSDGRTEERTTDRPPPQSVELDTSHCWSLVRGADVGRLAVLVDEHPDIFPVNHVVDHGTVVFRTGAGTKLAAAHGRSVAFEVDGFDPRTGTAWSVVIKGRAARVREPYGALEALALPLVPWHGGPKPWFLRIEPDTVTGRRFTVTRRGSEVAGGRHWSPTE